MSLNRCIFTWLQKMWQTLPRMLFLKQFLSPIYAVKISKTCAETFILSYNAYLFHRQELQKRKNKMTVQKVSNFSGEVVLRHLCSGKREVNAGSCVLRHARIGQSKASTVSSMRCTGEELGCLFCRSIICFLNKSQTVLH